MMFGNQIHPLHWNRSEGWILDRVPLGTVDRIYPSVSRNSGETGRAEGRRDHLDSLSRVWRSGPPRRSQHLMVTKIA